MRSLEREIDRREPQSHHHRWARRAGLTRTETRAFVQFLENWEGEYLHDALAYFAKIYNTEDV